MERLFLSRKNKKLTDEGKYFECSSTTTLFLALRANNVWRIVPLHGAFCESFNEEKIEFFFLLLPSSSKN
jgi:hypothetical protein